MAPRKLQIKKNTHRAVDFRGEIAALSAWIVLQATCAVLDLRKTIHANVVLVTASLAGYENDVIRIIIPAAQIVHAVDILRIVTAIGQGVVLQSIGALTDHRSAVEAENVLGARAIVTER